MSDKLVQRVAEAAIDFEFKRLEINQTMTTIEHMTPERATAAIEVARLTSAVPAQEDARKTVVTQRQETSRFALVVGFALAALVLAFFRPALTAVVGVVVTAVTGVLGGPKIIDSFKKKAE